MSRFKPVTNLPAFLLRTLVKSSFGLARTAPLRFLARWIILIYCAQTAFGYAMYALNLKQDNLVFIALLVGIAIFYRLLRLILKRK